LHAAARLQRGQVAVDLGSIHARLVEPAEVDVRVRREVSRGAAHSVTGKRIPRELLDRYGAEEAEVDAALARAELKFAAASAALKESRERAAAAEELGHASSSALDVDQLRVEIGSLRERIDGTADEIEKMRRKSAVAVQVITHVREKLHSVRRAREAAEGDLAALEGELGRQRAALAAAKKEKDAVRADNEEAVRQQGFVFKKAGKTELSADFARRQREVLRLKELVERGGGT
jgi:chromosome segregation ATPase